METIEINTLYAKHIERTSIKKEGEAILWIPDTKYRLGTVILGYRNINDESELPKDYDTTIYRYRMHNEIATGTSERTKINNIYDMAGNMWEWTTEEGFHKTSDGESSDKRFAVLRGGGFQYYGEVYPIVTRHGDITTKGKYLYFGFRVVLYIL